MTHQKNTPRIIVPRPERIRSQAALRGRDTIDGPFLKAFVADHPIFQNQGVTA